MLLGEREREKVSEEKKSPSRRAKRTKPNQTIMQILRRMATCNDRRSDRADGRLVCGFRFI